MTLYRCILTGNDCFKRGQTIVPRGVMVHSTGANNPNLRRYVQPDDGILGENPSRNHWNRAGVEKCVHAFIGRTADGRVATYQTLPWTMRGWHAGGGANDTHIGFEICEDDLGHEDYFRSVYREAVELTAYLCRTFGLDPLADGVAICHAEGYRRGIASGHGDVEHWFPRFGKTMDDFRRETAERMREEDGEMDEKRVEEMIGRELAASLPVYAAAEDVPEWYRPTIRKLVEKGALRGTDPAGAALNVSEDYCRVMTTLDRMGKLD